MKKIVQKSKRAVKFIIGKDFFPKLDVKCPIKRFGSANACWDIIPDFVNRNSIVYSFGVGEEASFDIGLINEFGLIVHAFDPTPKSIDWVKKQKFCNNFVFHEVGIADFDGEVLFYPPDNSKHVSHTILKRSSSTLDPIKVKVKQLETLLSENGHAEIDILKLDIEGAEYLVIDQLENLAIRPSQLLVEFHHRFPKIGLQKTKSALVKLKKIGYQLYSVSTTGQEFCFIHKSLRSQID